MLIFPWLDGRLHSEVLLCPVLLKLNGRQIGESGVHPLLVVEEFNVVKEHRDGFLSRGWDAIAKVIEALGLERTPEALHQSIVVAVALAGHALLYFLLFQKKPERFAGILGALIRVMQRGMQRGMQRWKSAGNIGLKSHLRCIHHRGRLHVVSGSPAGRGG